MQSHWYSGLILETQHCEHLWRQILPCVTPVSLTAGSVVVIWVTWHVTHRWGRGAPCRYQQRFFLPFLTVINHRQNNKHCCFVPVVEVPDTPENQVLSCLGSLRHTEAHTAGWISLPTDGYNVFLHFWFNNVSEVRKISMLRKKSS